MKFHICKSIYNFIIQGVACNLEVMFLYYKSNYCIQLFQINLNIIGAAFFICGSSVLFNFIFCQSNSKLLIFFHLQSWITRMQYLGNQIRIIKILASLTRIRMERNPIQDGCLYRHQWDVKSELCNTVRHYVFSCPCWIKSTWYCKNTSLTFCITWVHISIRVHTLIMEVCI